MDNETKDQKRKTIAEIINLAYYYIFGVSILVNKFERQFRIVGIDEKGMLKLRVNSIKDNISMALKQLNTFDDTFLAACDGSGEKWDGYVSIANELIALNLLYLANSYADPKDAARVFEVIHSQDKGNKVIEELSDTFLRKALIK